MKKLALFLFVVLSFYLNADGPHPVYVEIRNALMEIPLTGDVTFQAWLLSNPDEVLDENSFDCFYPAFVSFVKINCGQFSTWNNEDVLHLWVQEISSGDEGIGEYLLSYDPSQTFYMADGGIILGTGGAPPEIVLPDQFLMDEDDPLSVDLSSYITGYFTGLTAAGGVNISTVINAASVTFIPALNWFGSEFITFEVTGMGGETDSDEVEVIVNPVNDAPVWNLPASFQFNEDGTFSQDIAQYAFDIESDQLTFTATGSTHIFTSVTGNILQLTAAENWNGTESIDVYASDDRTREVTMGSVSVIVNPVNDAPELDLPEQMTFQAEEEATFDFAQYMEDIDGDDLYISVYGDDDLTVSIAGSLVTFTYETGWHGSEELVFTVDDNALRATASDTVMINIFYPDDTTLSCGNYEINDGQSLTVSIWTTEIFEEWSAIAFDLFFEFNPLVLEYTSVSLDNSILDGGSILVTEQQPGVLLVNYAHYLPISGAGILVELDFEAICFGVSDLNLDTCILNTWGLPHLIDGEVIVNNIGLPHPPFADAGADFGVTSGSEGSLDGSASFDPDGDDITFLWNAPPEIILDTPTQAITQFTAPIVLENTPYTITLTVSDGMYDAVDMVVVTVVYMNHTPEIELPDQFSFVEDGELEVDFADYVFDLDGDDLVIVASISTNIIVEINELIVTFSALENWNGEEIITFTVTDNVVARPSDDVNVCVTAENDLPHADAGMDMNGRDGNTITLNGSASWDVETEELQYIWIAPPGVMLDDPYSITPSFMAPQVVDPTEYEFTLQVSDGEATDEDAVIVTIQDDEPVLLYIELLPDNNALFTWFAPGSGGSGQELEQGFEGVIPPQGWTNRDIDEDGYGWYIYVQEPHSGSSSIASQSYNPNAGALTPDNWLITPAIQIGAFSELRYWIAAQDPYYPAEHYSVLVSTQGTEIQYFEDILIEETLTDNVWNQHIFSLQPWAGSMVNIAWRHHDVTDQFIIKLDDVQIINNDGRSETRELLGYNVYLDDDFQEFVEIREYMFTDVAGAHTAGVAALYDTGESEIVEIDFVTANDPELIAVTELLGAFPNPFNPETTIAFSLKDDSQVNISVYNIRGQKVASIIDDRLSAGSHSIIWQADKYPSGIYFIKMQAGDYQKINKTLLLK
ncbi:MAG: choice-of-anchor J domain-containing protein [Candidatus Cloacimonetes bacterium]|nr:choice-of-anchor J domain-containing protein [Candidatus Cloacimonadota bacterium]